MKFHFPDGQHYDCVQCAKGCRSPWRIRIDPASESKIYGSDLDRRLREQLHEPTLITELDGTVLPARRERGACVFLNGNLCSVHSEMGVDAKPLACRQFPFLYQPTPDGMFVGVSFYCTAVQENSGRLLADHQPDLEPVVANLTLEMIGENPIKITSEIFTDWPGYKMLESYITRLIDSLGYEIGLSESLSRLCRLAFHAREESIKQSDFSKMLDPWQDPPLNSIMQSEQRLYLAALVALIEIVEPRERKEFTNALLSGASCAFNHFSWTGRMEEISRCCTDFVGNQFDGEIERYIRALIHRKFLAARRTVLVNLTILHLLPSILKFYTALAMLSRNSNHSDLPDFFRALDIAEIELITHVKGIDRLLAILSAGYLQTVNAILRDSSD